MLQWLGGIGIIVIAVAIFPILKIGGMQLFQTEFSSKRKVLPRTTQIATAIGFIYFLLTLLSAVFFLYSTGLSFFDSLAHGLTIIAIRGIFHKKYVNWIF